MIAFLWFLFGFVCGFGGLIVYLSWRLFHD